jgi:hypothetical protein
MTLEHTLSSMPVANDVDVNQLVLQTSGYSGAEIVGECCCFCV